MFRRRTTPSFLDRVVGFFWPKAGFRRSSTYVVYRVARLKGSVYSLAAGFACGSAISFTPFVGFHFILGALLALIMRGNVLASAIGTAVGNPWTFPFIWVWIYNLGVWMGAGGFHEDGSEIDFAQTFEMLMTAVMNLDGTLFINQVLPLFWPMFVGGLPTAVIAWLISFGLIKRLILGVQKRRVTKGRRKAARMVHYELEKRTHRQEKG